MSEPEEKDIIAGRTGRCGLSGLKSWPFSKRFTRFIEQNLIDTIGSLTARWRFYVTGGPASFVLEYLTTGV